MLGAFLKLQFLNKLFLTVTVNLTLTLTLTPSD
jgi:hypothetical protein